ncbi:MAG: hypothetical protein AAFW89_13625 [Bacteroidota bacterium]
MKGLLIYASLLLGIVLQGCTQSFTLKDVDYTQHLESVLEPEADGTVVDIRHGIQFNVLPLQFEELGDSSQVTIREIRVIRDSDGWYYLTAGSFRHVYVMEPQRRALKLRRKVKVSDSGLIEPAFNARVPYVVLLDHSLSGQLVVTPNGIKQKEKQS